MESKICTYTEKKVRLQLVRIEPLDERPYLELRFNRRVIRSYTPAYADEAKLYFLHVVHKILMDRTMSDLTSETYDVRA